MLLNISLLNKYGYKISHIDKMTEEEMSEKLLMLSQGQAQQERLVNELISYMVDMDMTRFEALLNKFIAARGIERAITQIIFPFLEKIGVLWLTSNINPAQEHLVTNIVRQKLIVGIENCVTHLSVDKNVLLFLPEGEHHELGLLYVHYILKSRGVKTLYLGANVPLKDLEYVVKLKCPDFLYTHLTSVAGHFNFDRFLNNVHQKCPDTPIVISGMLTQTYRKSVPGKIVLKRSLQEVMEFVSGI